MQCHFYKHMFLHNNNVKSLRQTAWFWLQTRSVCQPE